MTFRMLKELAETIVADKPTLAPLSVWHAYELLENVSGQPKNELNEARHWRHDTDAVASGQVERENYRLCRGEDEEWFGPASAVAA